jgi:hypothetical protein
METKIAESASDKSRGQLTAKMARKISQDWKERGYDVLYDHDPSSENVGKVVSWFGNNTEKDYKNETRLSNVDIAIVKQNSNDVIFLIEIEETNDKPKTFLGDAFGVLFGEHIRFRRERELSVGENTALIILGKSKASHEKRNRYLCEKVLKVKSSLSTANSAIGKVFIETFSDEEKLASVLDKAFKGEL